MQQVTLARPEQPAHARYGRFDTSDKTVGEVVAHLARQLRAAEIEPEWIDVANFVGDDCRAQPITIDSYTAVDSSGIVVPSP